MDDYNALTYETYRYMLGRLLEEYSFTSFSKIKYSNEKPVKKVLLRHDIDLSLEKALEMAEIEHEMGISAVYFLFLRSPFYNIFSGREEKIINKIISLQHYIGLHFDFAKYEDLTVSQMSYQIKKEIDFIQDFFGIKLDAVSFHRPLSLDFFSRLELSNYPHAYEPSFVNNFKYLSDSRGLWRFGHPLDSKEFAEKMNMHILVHPIWWNTVPVQDTDSLMKFKEYFIQNFDENLYTELKSFWEGKNIIK
jgi:hypothetical protein